MIVRSEAVFAPSPVTPTRNFPVGSLRRVAMLMGNGLPAIGVKSPVELIAYTSTLLPEFPSVT